MQWMERFGTFHDTPMGAFSDHRGRKHGPRIGGCRIVRRKAVAHGVRANYAKENEMMNMIDETTPIPATEMDQLGEWLTEDCKSRGMEETIRAFLGEPFGRWMDFLADSPSGVDGPEGARGLSRSDILAIAVAMERAMSVRDALLVSIVAGEDRSPRGFLMDFMTNPMHPDNSRRLEGILKDSFRNVSATPDDARCDSGVTMMFDIIEMVPERYQVQPLAVISYVLWWMGDERAMLCALRALALDEDCSLAAIVCSAVHRHIGPAWTSET